MKKNTNMKKDNNAKKNNQQKRVTLEDVNMDDINPPQQVNMEARNPNWRHLQYMRENPKLFWNKPVEAIDTHIQRQRERNMARSMGCNPDGTSVQLTDVPLGEEKREQEADTFDMIHSQGQTLAPEICASGFHGQTHISEHDADVMDIDRDGETVSETFFQGLNLNVNVKAEADAFLNAFSDEIQDKGVSKEEASRIQARQTLPTRPVSQARQTPQPLPSPRTRKQNALNRAKKMTEQWRRNDGPALTEQKIEKETPVVTTTPEGWKFDGKLRDISKSTTRLDLPENQRHRWKKFEEGQ